MHNLHILFIVGSAILLAWGGAKIVNRFRLPLVIGYMLIGVILGKSFLNIFNPSVLAKADSLNDLALGIIAFMIGGELNLRRLRGLGKVIIFIAIFETLFAFLLVSTSCYLLTKKIYYALILGAVASATAPAATVTVINQYRAKGPLTTTILGVVGSDDAFALIIYAFASAISYPFLLHKNVPVFTLISHPLREVVFSLVGGIILGIILSFLLNRSKSREEILAISIGFLLLGEGLALQFNFSEILLIMAMAMMGENLVPRKFRFVIEQLNLIGFPIIASFFCLAASRLDIKLLPKIGIIGFVYLLSRILGKYLGARLGAAISGAPYLVRKYIGLSLWPQIGVAVALAILVERDFSSLLEGKQLAVLVMNVLLFTTIFTEILGPLATRFSLKRAGEIRRM
jgi:Kef-type K+ transport system membrane component KefB